MAQNSTTARVKNYKTAAEAKYKVLLNSNTDGWK